MTLSSDGEDYNEENPSLKKRRVQRACDICRRKKSDGGSMPGNRCSNCIAYSFECTYIEAAKKRGPPKGYVERLESRLEKLEKLLNRLCPDETILKELDASLDTDNWQAVVEKKLSGTRQSTPSSHPNPNDPSQSNAHLQSPPFQIQCQDPTTPKRTPTEIATGLVRHAGAPPPESLTTDEHGDDDFAHMTLADDMQKMNLDKSEHRFFGKSSSIMLVQTAIELKNEYTGVKGDFARTILGSRRPEFWTSRPWESAAQFIQKETYTFPTEDLMTSLIELFFENINIFIPLLHRPTFEKHIQEKLHYRDDGFAAVLLLVCAVAARYSDDPRTRLDGVDSVASQGWKWYNQVQWPRKSLLSPPSLYDLQYYCLATMFLHGSSAPQSCWTLVGIGIRLAQDVGAHRRKYNRMQMTAEDEMWKRAFWVLVCMDRMVSSALGRPCAIQDEDFDVDFPVECDDEYWYHTDPKQMFKQPAGKPSRISYFILFLRLTQVLAILLRTIYSINKSRILLGFVGQQWEQHIVAELDSALNKWVDSVPDHLRWDPNRENLQFFNQSALLYCTYYNIQILIHRPFIPSPRKPSPLVAFPSLAICTNAARSCSHIIDVQRRRSPTCLPHVQMAVFTAGIVLLLNIWGGKRSGLNIDPAKEMADVHKCMQALRACEARWYSSGRLWDILYELASVGDLPLPSRPSPPTYKRDRDSDEPQSNASSPLTTSTSNNSSPPLPSAQPRTVAGTRRVTGLQQQQQQGQPMQGVNGAGGGQKGNAYPYVGSLPMYSNELGTVPTMSNGQSMFSAGPTVGAGANAAGGAGGGGTGSGYWYPAAGSGTAQGHGGAQGQSQSQVGGGGPGAILASVFNPPESTYGIVDGLLYDQMGFFPGSTAFGGQPLGGRPGGGGGGGPMNVNGVMGGGGGGGHPHDISALVGGYTVVDNGANGGPVGLGAGPGGNGGGGGGMGDVNMQALIDGDTMSMWSTAPTGFELDDWGTYLNNVSELTHGHHACGSSS